MNSFIFQSVLEQETESLSFLLTSDPSGEMYMSSCLYCVEHDNWKPSWNTVGRSLPHRSLCLLNIENEKSFCSVWIYFSFQFSLMPHPQVGKAKKNYLCSYSSSFVSSSFRRTNWTCPPRRCTAPLSPTAGQSLTSTPLDTRACRWETPSSASRR